MKVAWDAAADVTAGLRDLMRICRGTGVSFTACMAEARKQFNREVREQADATPLPTPSK